MWGRGEEAGLGREPYPDCWAQGGVETAFLRLWGFSFESPTKWLHFQFAKIKFSLPQKINFHCQKSSQAFTEGWFIFKQTPKREGSSRSKVKSVSLIFDLCQELNHSGMPCLKPCGAVSTHAGVSETLHPLPYFWTLSSICVARGLTLKTCVASPVSLGWGISTQPTLTSVSLFAKGRGLGFSPPLMLCLFSCH